MTEPQRLALGIYNEAGLGALRHAIDTEGLIDIAVYTHRATAGLPDIEAEARRLGLWVTTQRMEDCKPPFAIDIISLVYYRNILPKAIIDSVDGRIYNCHPSLLPRHRGCSSIPWAIIEGDRVTGITYHWVDEKIDSGNVLLQASLEIASDETAATLYERAMQKAIEFWPAGFALAVEGFPGVPQSGSHCYHKRGAPHNGMIDPGWSLAEIARFIRAMTFPPLPYARFKGMEVRTLEEYLALSGSTPDR